MRRFARLYAALDATTRTNEKVAAMAAYFGDAPAADAAWAVWFLSGGRPKRLVPVRRLAAWAMELAAVPEWLFDECYHAVGDLAETITLLLPPGEPGGDVPLATWVESVVLPLAGAPEEEQRDVILRAWAALDGTERFVFNKLVTGAFRVGVSRSLVVRALSRAGGVDEPVVAHRLTGAWEPTADAFRRLLSTETADADASQPYPFYLAYPLEGDVESLGDAAEWQAELKWDGIRAQLVRRAGRSFLWSRGEESVAERFPELVESAAFLPDGTVVDGEVMPWRDDGPLGFDALQRRIGRLDPGPRILAEVPVVMLLYDLLEHEGEDVRGRPFGWRRERLAALVAAQPTGSRLRLAPAVAAAGWADVRRAFESARDAGAEGLMLKRRDSAYGVGRRKGGWWKWKVDPYSVDAVMIYAQAGHGRRASLHTDYTFAVRDGDALVPFAKAYSGLTDAEIRRLDAWIRRNTVERFGPVRSVQPLQVFEIGFEGIRRSTRHKSGVAVRFPRILRWREDKTPDDADTIEALRALLDPP